MKRNYQSMCAMNMDGVAYHDFSQGGYYSSPPQPPPPPQTVLFSNPFPSPQEYPQDGYIGSVELGYFPHNNRSLSEPFIHQPTESFGGSQTSSCTASVGPATPPLPSAPFKYPAVPITPSHVAPRQKAKRTATACEECRKRKQKCDGESPCQSCKEQKLECRYREVSPTKKDNSMEKLMSLIEAFGKSMDALHKRLDGMSSTLCVLEKRLSRCCHCGSPVELETGTCHSCNRGPRQA